jgi:hypothetical protein
MAKWLIGIVDQIAEPLVRPQVIDLGMVGMIWFQALIMAWAKDARNATYYEHIKTTSHIIAAHASLQTAQESIQFKGSFEHRVMNAMLCSSIHDFFKKSIHDSMEGKARSGQACAKGS